MTDTSMPQEKRRITLTLYIPEGVRRFTPSETIDLVRQILLASPFGITAVTCDKVD